MKINMSAKIGKLKLDNPLVLLSGTAGYGTEVKSLVDLRKVGAVIAKTITLNPREGNSPPRITEVYGGVINAIGLENPGVDVFIEKYWPQINKNPCETIVSVGGHSVDDFVKCIKKLDKISSIKAIELNLSCPNVRMKKLMSQDVKLIKKLISSLRPLTKKTLIAKLTPQVTDIVEIAKAAQDEGIDGLALVNTFPAMKIDINTRKPFLANVYGGLSGRCVKPMAVAIVHKVYKATKMPIIATGGVYSYEDVVEYIMAGAEFVGIGTANFTYPDIAQRILKDLQKYMKDNKISSLKDIKAIV